MDTSSGEDESEPVFACPTGRKKGTCETDGCNQCKCHCPAHRNTKRGRPKGKSPAKSKTRVLEPRTNVHAVNYVVPDSDDEEWKETEEVDDRLGSPSGSTIGNLVNKFYTLKHSEVHNNLPSAAARTNPEKRSEITDNGWSCMKQTLRKAVRTVANIIAPGHADELIARTFTSGSIKVDAVKDDSET